MRALAAAFVAGSMLAAPALDARQSRAPEIANYRLEATLNPATHAITGRGRLTWRNATANATSELQFHLYWNAWRDAQSTWMREQRFGRNPGLAARPPADWAAFDVTRLVLAGIDGSEDLLPGARFIAPDDGNAEDRTVLAVPLPRPVAPGETIDVDLAWTARVPRTFARTGRLGDYYFIAQWFPKIGVLEDTGWNCHQFHAATEFFADFGRYDVTLTVPSGWGVGATGRLESATDRGDGTAAHRFVATDVHDFAWTTSPDFIDLRERFEAPSLPSVEMRLLLQPEHVAQAARHFDATRVALSRYGAWFGPYPYDHITIVDPVTIVHDVTQGQGTGGMEYPTLFTAGTRWIAPVRGTQPESVTIHEAGHQFWYGIVATNEFEHAWMDEGLNTFSTARAMADAYHGRFVAVERYFGGLVGWAYHDVPWTRDVDGNRLNAFRRAAAFEIQATPTWRYQPATSGLISYNKTALWLATLERHLGWDTLRRILATYFQRTAFSHPSPDEFFAIANEMSGQDLTWFFDAVYRSNAVFDYAVGGVTVLPARTGAEAEQIVLVRRIGDGVFPVDVRVTFSDGTERRERWDGRDPWREFRYHSAARVRAVDLDPDRVLLLDINVTNNTWLAEPRAANAARRWSARWLTWLQEVLLTYAAFV
jgi:hypothetical protein